MRSLYAALIGAVILAASPADAKIDIVIDKDSQLMTVNVDGVERYKWPVSSGNPSHETPSGSFRAFRLEEDHYSKEFDEAPMPHSIFFTKRGHAIHGTDFVSRLGNPASHGCVRLTRANAATLFALVQADGVLNTTVTLTGSAQVALARNAKKSTRTAARIDAPSPAAAEPGDIADRTFDVMQEPAVPAQRRVRQAAPRVDDDGYIYPADGSSTDRRYPAPRGYRRVYDLQGNTYYYNNNDYADRRGSNSYVQPEYAPRPVYRQRGLFSDFD